MKDLKFDENITGINHTKKSFIYNFLSSVRQKIDDPLGKKRIKKQLKIQPAITANNSKATIFVILIIGLTAGPAVSL